jgi:quercetin 2,3-dioxygenase
MQNTVLHKAATRGHANHGWLNAHHTFSFGSYYNPQRIQFGALRVLNDDEVAPTKGFGEHPHDNMEIITIPLAGALTHADSMGNEAIIQNGEVQVMSAGTGIFHSEFNKSTTDWVKLLQIWLFPNKKNVTPRYQQVAINLNNTTNQLQQIVSPNPTETGAWIHQSAWFSLGTLDANFTTNYTIKQPGNGAYIFVINGTVTINNQMLETRDGFGIWDIEAIEITATTNAQILVMDVPMNTKN